MKQVLQEQSVLLVRREQEVLAVPEVTLVPRDRRVPSVPKVQEATVALLVPKEIRDLLGQKESRERMENREKTVLAVRKATKVQKVPSEKLATVVLKELKVIREMTGPPDLRVGKVPEARKGR